MEAKQTAKVEKAPEGGVQSARERVIDDLCFLPSPSHLPLYSALTTSITYAHDIKHSFQRPVGAHSGVLRVDVGSEPRLGVYASDFLDDSDTCTPLAMGRCYIASGIAVCAKAVSLMGQVVRFLPDPFLELPCKSSTRLKLRSRGSCATCRAAWEVSAVDRWQCAGNTFQAGFALHTGASSL